MIARGGQMKKWMKTTISDFAGRFKDPVMREAFLEMWIPEFSVFFMMFALDIFIIKMPGILSAAPAHVGGNGKSVYLLGRN